jgi:phenylacetate-coenzyme A ligase PaaK-like adenylate-forming protein
MNPYSMLRITQDVWRVGRSGMPAVEARQRTRLAELVAFARERSPYYREHYKGLPSRVSDPRLLPPVTKPELMENFDGWVTDPVITWDGVEAFVSDPALIGHEFLDRYMVWTTSGTTGTPAILVHDRRSLAVMTALSVMRVVPAWVSPRDLLEFLRRGGRSASVWATSGHFFGVTMAERQRRSRASRRRRIRVFSVMTPVDELVRELNAFKPTLLSAYPSALSLLTREQEAGRLRLSPMVITAAGESLAPEARERAEAAFGARVWNNYSASEAGVIAFECEHGRLHLNADWYVLEPVDENHQPVLLGQPSRTLLLTNLANRVQPVIRYELGDSVTLELDPCPCGRYLPTLRVEGRTDDTLSFEENGRTVRLLPLALGTVIEETSGVRRFQAIKTAPKALSVRLEVEPGANPQRVWEALTSRLEEYFSAQGLSTVEVERSAESPRPNPRSGKFRQVWTEV